jgi:hypothetical protein
MPKFREFTDAGIPLDGGKLYTAQPGTVAGPLQPYPKVTYQDGVASAQNTNPVILDSTGRANVWLSGNYSMALYTSAGVLIWSQDNVSGAGSGSAGDLAGTVLIFGDATLATYNANILSADDPDAPEVYEISKLDASANPVRITPVTGTVLGRAYIDLTVRGSAIRLKKYAAANDWMTTNGLPAVEDTDLTNGTATLTVADVITKDPWADVRAYGGSIKAAFAASSNVLLPEGDFIIDNDPIYLDSTATNKTYILRGSGKGTRILLNNFSAGYAFYVNETSGGAISKAYAPHPRFIVENLTIDGSGSSDVSFAKVNQTGMIVEKVLFNSVTFGVRAYDYCDQMQFSEVYWTTPKAGGWLFENTQKGDSLLFSQVFATDTDVLKLNSTQGAVIQACNGGHYEINGSQVSVSGGHYEFMDTNHVFTIRNSVVDMSNNFFRQDNGTYYPIYLDDATTSPLQRSALTLNNNRFTTYWNDPTPGQHAIMIHSMSQASEITLNGNTGGMLRSGYPSTTLYSNLESGIGIASNVAGGTPSIGTAIDNVMNELSGNMRIFYREGGWRVLPVGSDIISHAALSAASITSGADSTEITAVSSLATQNYLYRVTTFGSFYRQTAASAPTTVAVTATHTAKLVVASTPYTRLRIQRSDDGGATYPYRAEIPVVSTETTLYDIGNRINNVLWIDDGGAPLAFASGSTALPGYTVSNDSIANSVFFAAAMPTYGTWSAGQIVFNTSSSTLSGLTGWKRLTTGNNNVLNTDWATIGTVNGSAPSIADGGTIAHGMGYDPGYTSVTGTVAGEIATVTAHSSMTITVAIKKHDGTAGTTQTINWSAR